MILKLKLSYLWEIEILVDCLKGFKYIYRTSYEVSLIVVGLAFRALARKPDSRTFFDPEESVCLVALWILKDFPTLIIDLDDLFTLL